VLSFGCHAPIEILCDKSFEGFMLDVRLFSFYETASCIATSFPFELDDLVDVIVWGGGIGTEPTSRLFL